MRYRRARIKGGTYLFTVVTLRRKKEQAIRHEEDDHPNFVEHNLFGASKD